MNELALFAGAGGGILGGKLLGWTTVCAVERDAYAAAVLARRQTDQVLGPFPIWSDVCTFDGRPWRGIVDVISGGFPCQDISSAGKGAGIDGERSGLWSEFARIIREVGARYVFVENSPMLTSRGLGRVLGDLAAMGYDARWGVLGAIHAGAPHRRERIWIVAHSAGEQHEGRTPPERGPAAPKLFADAAQYGRGPGRARGLASSDQGESEQSFQILADAARLQQGREEQRPARERAGSRGESSAPDQTRPDQTRPDQTLFATPKARDWKEQTLSSALAKMAKNPKRSLDLPRQLSAQNPELHGGSLNPEWVEWLMGWPRGWTDLKHSGTAKYRQWQRSHGKS